MHERVASAADPGSELHGIPFAGDASLVSRLCGFSVRGKSSVNSQQWQRLENINLFRLLALIVQAPSFGPSLKSSLCIVLSIRSVGQAWTFSALFTHLAFVYCVWVCVCVRVCSELLLMLSSFTVASWPPPGAASWQKVSANKRALLIIYVLIIQKKLITAKRCKKQKAKKQKKQKQPSSQVLDFALCPQEVQQKVDGNISKESVYYR